MASDVPAITKVGLGADKALLIEYRYLHHLNIGCYSSNQHWFMPAWQRGKIARNS